MPFFNLFLKNLRSRLHNYDEVVERVASHICLDNPTKIQLTSFDFSTCKAKSQPIKYRGVDTLLDMLVDGNQVKWYFLSILYKSLCLNKSFNILYEQISGILHYDVLDISLLELEHLITLNVVFYRSTIDEVSITANKEVKLW